MRVIIVRPHGYSGGSLVLDEMCSNFRKKGVDASLFFVPKEPKKNTRLWLFWLKWLFYRLKWNYFHSMCRLFPHTKNKRFHEWRPVVISPVKGVRRKKLPFFSKRDTIVIYPEKVYGNFLHATHVVRYLLYHYAFADDKKAYGKDDLFIAYREVFNNPSLNPEKYFVWFGHFDNELYRQYNFGNRKGNCYIIRKGSSRNDLPERFDGPVIDKLPEEEKVKILNETERCYLYDTQTFYSSIAAVCGCLPIIVPEPGKTKEDYYASWETHPGQAFGESAEEIEHALKTRKQCIENLNYDKINEENANYFIKILKENF